jgi:hypothetical protein
LKFIIEYSNRAALKAELFRRSVIKYFQEKELRNEKFARNLLSWKHSGFSIDNS